MDVELPQETTLMNLFEQRRLVDPQGVIDDLIAQIGRQAAALHEKNKKLGEAEPADGVEPLGQAVLEKIVKPRPKKSAGRQKNQNRTNDQQENSNGNL